MSKIADKVGVKKPAAPDTHANLEQIRDRHVVENTTQLIPYQFEFNGKKSIRIALKQLGQSLELVTLAVNLVVCLTW